MMVRVKMSENELKFSLSLLEFRKFSLEENASSFQGHRIRWSSEYKVGFVTRKG